ncbi:hypothetical protein Tsubulata_003818 [Turnera subulata]|uniref:Uncharacterized protein n=1 Tax=Turnera subulata TaxID=218843 RepID=A0A9Q0JQ30_9ROSI|nr:hypothetical protein Tsubulata_003818 [Turnera subulata]
MGNCLFGAGEADDDDGVIKVIISGGGGVMELYGPVTAGCITSEFPGHAIFPSHDHQLFWRRPLYVHEELLPGHKYYLFPETTGEQQMVVREGHVRSKSIPTSVLLPYRMSNDCQGTLKRSYTDVFSRSNSQNHNHKRNNGFWKVKLVIKTEQLQEILSQEARTQELIENMRAVAKCGNGLSFSSTSSIGFSDQWSLSSSRNASSKKDALVGL